ncbi:IS4 family transposase [Nonomuraea sp. NPDC049649]|uniref:IS4 family transposase n=1 Tax=Nonomuraea sp. NPDC049649 TaxID=3155776 RepID=UPI00344A1C64
MAGAQEPSVGGRLTDHISLGVLAAAFSRDLIEEVVDATGSREKRSRLLPAHVMVRYVIGLGLLFGQAYEEVMRQMTGALQHLGCWERDWKVPSTSAISQARQRLGSAPLKELFHRAAVPVAGLGTQGAWLRHRRLMAIDGTSFDVPDTEANVAAFGKMGSGPQQSAFPKLQVVSLSECGTHAMVAAAMGSCRTGERELASELAGHLDGDMLVTADSGFYSWQLWDLYSASDAALCWRVGASVALPLVRRLPDGSYLALIFAPNTPAKRKAALLAAARAGEQVDEDRARVVRAVEYTVPDRGGPDGELVCVITTILDPAELSAPEAAFAYYQRWEHESGLDEIKTHLRGGGGVLRSQSPDLVEQEMWGILLAHYAIRELMCRAADEADLDPDRVSFIRAVRVVRRQIDDPAAFSP